jgi:Flp pilus assembly protein TadD
LDARSLRVWRHRAAAAVRVGRVEEACLCYRVMLRLDTTNPRAYLRAAACYIALGSSGAALKVCRDAITRFPDEPSLHRQLGQVLFSRGEVHTALRALSRAAELGPRHCDTQYFVGLALRHVGRRREAREVLRHAVSLRPDDPKLYYALGLCCEPEADGENPVSLLLSGLAAEQLATESAPPGPLARL